MSRDLTTTTIKNTKKRQHAPDVHYSDTTRKSRKLSDGSSPGQEHIGNEDGGNLISSSKHTKKERKYNRSTRIHSLRKQLARGVLPSNIQQERERELAALLHEQGKRTSEQQAKRTLERYHYVRFLERRKAEKKLKQLRKQQEKQDSTKLSKQIHDLEVTRNYAVYAPLGQKYVSVFVSSSDKEDSNGGHQARPAMWYKVEAAMANGEKDLQKLRDSRSVSDEHVGETEDHNDDQVRNEQSVGKVGAKSSAHKKAFRHSRLDSHAESGDGGGGLISSSEDDTVDGGFFER